MDTCSERIKWIRIYPLQTELSGRLFLWNLKIGKQEDITKHKTLSKDWKKKVKLSAVYFAGNFRNHSWNRYVKILKPR